MCACVCVYSVGELGKLELLQEGILHKCIKQLIERKKLAPGGAAARISDMSEDMECLCEIMRTVGQRLDHDRARPWMDQYFERIRAYQSNQELPARIRFLLQDIIELRARNWQLRKILLAEGAPKTIQQVGKTVCGLVFAVIHFRQNIDCAVPKGSKRHFLGHFLLFTDYDTTANNTSPVKFLEASCAWSTFGCNIFDV